MNRSTSVQWQVYTYIHDSHLAWRIFLLDFCYHYFSYVSLCVKNDNLRYVNSVLPCIIVL
jgi:hypothetical protein